MRKKIYNCLIAILIITFLTGCSKPGSPATVPAAQQMAKEKRIGEITDPAELDKIWREYLYHSLATVCNTREFNSASEIDLTNVVYFVWFKYIAEHGKESLELARTDSHDRLLPLDVVLKYTERYFNLRSIDPEKVKYIEYDKAKKAFALNIGGNETTARSYMEQSPFGIQLGKVTRNSEGTINAELLSYVYPQKIQIEIIRRLTFVEREDGTLYFAKGSWEYINNNLVALSGNYQRFDSIAGLKGDLQDVSMAGAIDGKLLIVHAPYQEDLTPTLFLVNPATMEAEKKLTINEKFYPYDLKLSAGKVLIRLRDRVIILSGNLEQLEDKPLPEVITAKMKREPKYDRNGLPDVIFGGYDITKDLSKIVYSDEKGLKLLNLIDGTERLLTETVPVQSKLMNNSYHINPRFVAEECKILTIMSGYEAILGYTLFDLVNDKPKRIDLVWEGLGGNIPFDTGLLLVNIPAKDSKTLYLDFHTGDITEVIVEKQGDTGSIREDNLCYVGQNYAAFVTYNSEYHSPGQGMSYLNRLDLQSMKVEQEITSIKAARIGILGVLADGRIIYWYNLNPSENGICITK